MSSLRLIHYMVIAVAGIAQVSCDSFKSKIDVRAAQSGLVTTVTKISPIVAKPGESVAITGTNILAKGRYAAIITLAGGSQKTASVQVVSNTSAKFEMPPSVGLGLKSVDNYDAKTKLATFDLIADQATNKLPILIIDASEICSTTSYIDKNGDKKTGTKDCAAGTVANCAADGSIGCITTSTYKSADTSVYSATDIKSGKSIGGVAGSLASCAADGAIGCVTVTNYKSADMAVAIAGNIKSGATIAGVAGSVTVGSNCTGDGQTGCMTTSTYKSADTTAIATTDLRVGKTLAGISGGLKVNCRNTGNSTYFNYDGADPSAIGNSGVTTGTAYDIWDSIDDYNGWSSNSAWSSNYVCDSTNWTDVTTTDGGSTFTTCAASSANCQYKDNISGLTVAKAIITGDAWNTALNDCYNSTYGGYAAHSWRLPTQKELMQLYVDGIVSVASADFITLATMQNNFWSASSRSAATVSAWVVNLASGNAPSSNKANGNYVVCVRP